MKRETTFSRDTAGPDGRGAYRYTLWREGLVQPPDLFAARVFPLGAAPAPRAFVQWIGLNPSTATETLDDPTLRRCMGWTGSWGFEWMCMTNLFAFRASDPVDMHAARSPEGPENDNWLVTIGQDAAMIILAWGDGGRHLERELAVRKLLARNRLLDKCWYLTKTQGGMPTHPLARGKARLPDILHPMRWRQ